MNYIFIWNSGYQGMGRDVKWAGGMRLEPSYSTAQCTGTVAPVLARTA